MSYFPEDIPFMSKEELRENGIRIPKDVTDTNVGNNSEIPNSSDAISRQWLLDCINDGWIKFDTDKDANRFIHLVRDIAPTIQPEKAQPSKEGTPSDLISRQAVLDAIVQCTNCGDEDTLREYVLKHSLDNGWTGGILEALDAVKDLPPAQPEPSILLSWVEKYIEWLKSLDNEFANLAAAHISVMVKKWRDEQNETD